MKKNPGLILLIITAATSIVVLLVVKHIQHSLVMEYSVSMISWNLLAMYLNGITSSSQVSKELDF
jgi:hypothetical protein